MTPEPLSESFLNRPKAELHIHLRGAMPAAFFAELVAKHPIEQALTDAPDGQLAFMGSASHLAPVLEGSLSPEASADALFRSLSSWRAICSRATSSGISKTSAG